MAGLSITLPPHKSLGEYPAGNEVRRLPCEREDGGHPHPPVQLDGGSHRGAESNQHTPRARGPMNHAPRDPELRVLELRPFTWKVRDRLGMFIQAKSGMMRNMEGGKMCHD